MVSFLSCGFPGLSVSFPPRGGDYEEWEEWEGWEGWELYIPPVGDYHFFVVRAVGAAAVFPEAPEAGVSLGAADGVLP